MRFLDRTVHQIRRNPALLTRRSPEPVLLEAVLRLYDPGLQHSQDWLIAKGTEVRWAALTPEQAAAVGVPADRRGAIIARDRNRIVGSFVLNGLASRLGGAIHPAEAHEDYVDVEVRLREDDGLGCDGVAGLIRPVLGARSVQHDHAGGQCRIVGAENDSVMVTYNWPVEDSGPIVDLELDVTDPADLPDLELLHRAATAIADASGATVVCRDFPVTRLEDIVPTADRLTP